VAARRRRQGRRRVQRPASRGRPGVKEGNRTIHYRHEAALVLTDRRRPAVCNLLCGCRAPGGVEIIRKTCDYSVYTKGVTEGVNYKDQPNKILSKKGFTYRSIPSRSLQLSKRPLVRLLCVFYICSSSWLDALVHKHRAHATSNMNKNDNYVNRIEPMCPCTSRMRYWALCYTP
jgi:hypothetical protein